MKNGGSPYLSMFDSIVVLLANGQTKKAIEIDSSLTRRIEETEIALNREDRHEDRIIWALRFYKKALIEQLLRMTRILSSTRRKPQLFKKTFGSFPAARQKKLRDELQKLVGVDITLFQYETGPDASRHLGSRVIYEINRHISHFLQVADIYGKNVPDNVISHLLFKEQPFGEIVLCFRLCEFDLKSDIFEKETIPEEDLCIIRVQDENYEGRGCTGALVGAFYDNAFSEYPTEKEFLAAMKSGELKRKSVIKIKPSFPIQLDMQNRIDHYTRKCLGDN